jgi:hypothetical protein
MWVDVEIPDPEDNRFRRLVRYGGNEGRSFSGWHGEVLTAMEAARLAGRWPECAREEARSASTLVERMGGQIVACGLWPWRDDWGPEHQLPPGAMP